jgi:hypothetical protein
MKTKNTLRDLYKFPGFRARATLRSNPEDIEGCTVTLERRQKKRSVPVAVQRHQAIGTGELMWCETWMPEQPASILRLSIAGLPARIAKP